ncbi:transposase [Streptomyces violascens]|uniref:transposase n=1 Tax=Streptomyces violascens TaxID=67381 RepID=UPI0036B82A46
MITAGAVKQTDCQAAASVHGVSTTASCLLPWRCTSGDPERRRRTGMLGVAEAAGEVGLTQDILDEVAGWVLLSPVLVADADYGQNAEFRDSLDE